MIMYTITDYIGQFVNILSCTSDKIILANWPAYGHIPHVKLYWEISEHIIMYPKLDYIWQLAIIWSCTPGSIIFGNWSAGSHVSHNKIRNTPH